MNQLLKKIKQNKDFRCVTSLKFTLNQIESCKINAKTLRVFF